MASSPQAPARPIPIPTPETAFFWEGTRIGELRLQRCDPCAHVIWPPRPFCPVCASRDVTVFKASGKAILYSYVISHRPPPAFPLSAPFSIAVVELEEGPHLLTNIVGCPQTPEALLLDMPVELVFEKQTDEISLPMFRPVERAA